MVRGRQHVMRCDTNYGKTNQRVRPPPSYSHVSKLAASSRENLGARIDLAQNQNSIVLYIIRDIIRHTTTDSETASMNDEADLTIRSNDSLFVLPPQRRRVRFSGPGPSRRELYRPRSAPSRSLAPARSFTSVNGRPAVRVTHFGDLGRERRQQPVRACARSVQSAHRWPAAPLAESRRVGGHRTTER